MWKALKIGSNATSKKAKLILVLEFFGQFIYEFRKFTPSYPYFMWNQVDLSAKTPRSVHKWVCKANPFLCTLRMLGCLRHNFHLLLLTHDLFQFFHCRHNTYSYITIVLPTLQWYHICHAQPSILEMSSIEFENKTQQRIVIAIVYEHIMDYVYIVAKTQMGTKLWQHFVYRFKSSYCEGKHNLLSKMAYFKSISENFGHLEKLHRPLKCILETYGVLKSPWSLDSSFG